MNLPEDTGASTDPLAIGWYGKLPGSGDFVTRRLPHAFLDPWDAWLRTVIAGSRALLGEGWQDAFLSMPAWRFVLGRGVAGEEAWAGLIIPSVDAVGRYFPLTAACRLPLRDANPLRTLCTARLWYDELEPVVLGVLAPGADRNAFDSELARRRFNRDLIVCREPLEQGTPVRETRSDSFWMPLPPDGDIDPFLKGPGGPASITAGPECVWLAEDSEIFGRCLLLGNGLPAAEQFCAMMNGKWASHGWQVRIPAASEHSTEREPA
jgi:type VI secretion system protein ImpM